MIRGRRLNIRMARPTRSGWLLVGPGLRAGGASLIVQESHVSGRAEPEVSSDDELATNDPVPPGVAKKPRRTPAGGASSRQWCCAIRSRSSFGAFRRWCTRERRSRRCANIDLQGERRMRKVVLAVTAAALVVVARRVIQVVSGDRDWLIPARVIGDPVEAPVAVASRSTYSVAGSVDRCSADVSLDHDTVIQMFGITRVKEKPHEGVSPTARIRRRGLFASVVRNLIRTSGRSRSTSAASRSSAPPHCATC
jgi:hypothetical protein